MRADCYGWEIHFFKILLCYHQSINGIAVVFTKCPVNYYNVVSECDEKEQNPKQTNHEMAFLEDILKTMKCCAISKFFPSLC